MSDMGISYVQNLLDLEQALHLEQSISEHCRHAPRRSAFTDAVDPELRRDEQVADRAAELEIELTVEGLCERLDEFGLAACRDRLDQILHELAEKELEAKADWS